MELTFKVSPLTIESKDNFLKKFPDAEKFHKKIKNDSIQIKELSLILQKIDQTIDIYKKIELNPENYSCIYNANEELNSSTINFLRKKGYQVFSQISKIYIIKW